MAAESLPPVYSLSRRPYEKIYIKTFGCQMNEYDSDKMPTCSMRPMVW